MSELTLSIAQTIIAAALSHARDLKLKPLAIVVLDDRGALKAAVSEDGTSLRRYEVAHGKAYGALALGTARDRSAKEPRNSLTSSPLQVISWEERWYLFLVVFSCKAERGFCLGRLAPRAILPTMTSGWSLPELKRPASLATLAPIECDKAFTRASRVWQATGRCAATARRRPWLQQVAPQGAIRSCL